MSPKTNDFQGFRNAVSKAKAEIEEQSSRGGPRLPVICCTLTMSLPLEHVTKMGHLRIMQMPCPTKTYGIKGTEFRAVRMGNRYLAFTPDGSVFLNVSRQAALKLFKSVKRKGKVLYDETAETAHTYFDFWLQRGHLL